MTMMRIWLSVLCARATHGCYAEIDMSDAFLEVAVDAATPPGGGGRLGLGGAVAPSRDERFPARRGGGAFLNGQPLSVSDTPTVATSLLATGYPYDIRSTRENNLAEHDAFAVRCRSIRAIGSAVLSFAWVAAGRLDAYWEPRLSARDVAARAVLVEEAGGRVTHMNGGPLALASP